MELIITIDTEPDCDRSWRRSSPLAFTSVLEGIPCLLRPLWDKYDIKPVYFVSPEVVGNDECCSVLSSEIRKGAIIGTHLHSEYVEPHVTINDPAGKISHEFPCFAHDKDIEYAKIKNFTEHIQDRLNYRPVWYRAARYGADIDTIRILAELGYQYDSSVTPGIDWSDRGGPDHRRSPLQPYWISNEDLYKESGKQTSSGIREYPITILGKRFGPLGKLLPDKWLFYRWLRPTHMTVFEQKRIIEDFIIMYRNPVFVLLFHSMEIMINKTPFVRNRLMQKRFIGNLEAIIAYIIKKNQFE
jgi:hypothetical protein